MQRTFQGTGPARRMGSVDDVAFSLSIPRLPMLPLVGRSEELALLRRSLERAGSGESAAVVLSGAEGMGRTRLAAVLRDEAERRGFLVATGVAYPMESGIPYALFCDLLDPLVREHTPASLLSLTRGAPEFQFVCPSLALYEPGAVAGAPEAIPDLRNRLLWNFPTFLDRLRRDRPLLLVLEDLEWADPSSLELLHFMARQSLDIPLMTLCTLDPAGSPGGAGVLEAVRSLTSRPGAVLRTLDPLEPEDVVGLVERGFGVNAQVIRGFAGSLCRWTGGNPLFLTASLESLVSSGRIRQDGGSWVGWDLEELSPPASVRELILERAEALSKPARTVADLAAVIGFRIRFEVLAQASGLEDRALFEALDELMAQGVLVEVTEGGEAFHAFSHPVTREVYYGALGAVRVRRMHAEVLRSLESLHGDCAIDRADELALHVEFAGDALDPVRGATYLAAAGRQALKAHADREAVRYLERAAAMLGDAADRVLLLEDLARAHQRRGRYDEAARLLVEAGETAGPDAPLELTARLNRRLGLVAYWAGKPEEAMGHLDRGLADACRARRPELQARLHLARSACLQEMARGREAADEAAEALRLGAEVGDARIQVSAHMNLILLHTWSGPTDQARRHGEAAISLAKATGSRVALLSAHWAMIVLEGLTGRPEATRRHLELAAPLAADLGSPLLRLQLAEVELEFITRIGEWDRSADLAAESIRMARDLNQRKVLPRLLVLSGLLHVARGDVEVARAEIEEVWLLTGASVDPRGGLEPAAMQTAILVRAGKAALALATGDHAEAIRWGEEGLELVDRSGYTAWAIHRLLPTVAEASLHLRDLPRAHRVASRLRKEAERFEHPLGMAWAEICEALVTWLEGDLAAGAQAMARGAEALEEMGLLPDAARLRRQVAGRLAELGDREGAVRELRHVHDMLSALGAAPELEKARGQFRELGARPPSRAAARGTGVLSAREVEIARLIGERRSNKAIGKDLGISPRTVGTHLSSIFRKLEVDSRSRLGDLVRDGRLETGLPGEAGFPVTPSGGAS